MKGSSIMKIDSTDIQILKILANHSRAQWKDIGEQIYMTGQAVGNRIRKMEDEGIIKGYTININEETIKNDMLGFLTIYMTTAEHDSFINLITTYDEIIEAHRISGDCCYLLKFKVPSNEALNMLLQKLLEYGNYSLYLSVNQLKKNDKFNEQYYLDYLEK
ncbi:Lrp/AsnC family transcriptional regulator [Staphylococcus gallinarum]|nr:Lrp/AsnC family transcriptional regulator [Staphylococcus gallinarum]